MDIFTILGLVLAFIGIIGGMMVEGGHPTALLSLPSFMIVIVGSFGALMISHGPKDAAQIVRAFKAPFLPEKLDFAGTMDKILELANLARREGLLALEGYTNDPASNPFLVKCLMLAIDGSSAEAIKETIETDMHIKEQDHKVACKVWQNWGTFAPTVGVLGAVLGLIHVMANLDNPAAIGPGIAVAFVATVYGVGYANVICMPAFFKMQRQGEQEQNLMSMILEGVVGIQSGLAPGALRSKLGVYIGDAKKGDEKK